MNTTDGTPSNGTTECAEMASDFLSSDESAKDDTKARALLNAGDAAVTWWRGKKPCGWGVQKHIDNPMVNCVTRREEMLARRAAAWFVATHPRYEK